MSRVHPNQINDKVENPQDRVTVAQKEIEKCVHCGFGNKLTITRTGTICGICGTITEWQ
jgi:hypothetical protein